MTNSEKAVVYGGMALGLYLLYNQWKCSCALPAAGTGSGCIGPVSNPDNPIPLWVQQLSRLQGRGGAFVPRCGIWGRCGQ